MGSFRAAISTAIHTRVSIPQCLCLTSAQYNILCYNYNVFQNNSDPYTHTVPKLLLT